MIKIIIFCLAVTVVTANPRPAVVNGNIAQPGQYPFLAYIYYNGTGGNNTDGEGSAVLISDKFLITKAESLQKWGDITVILGALNLSQPETGTQKFLVKYEDIIFPKNITIKDDIAIVPLPQPANLTERVQPALLPRRSEQGVNYFGSAGAAVGWDSTSVLGYRAAFKPNVVSSNDACGVFVFASVLCIPFGSGETVDLGGPFVLDRPEGKTVIGLYYFDREVLSRKTNVFIRTNAFLDYIANNTGITIRP